MSDNFIWTKHVEQRSLQRGVGANEVWSTLRHPDRTEKLSGDKYKFYKQIYDKKIVIVAVTKGNQWVILTTWVKGREDGYRKNSGGWGNWLQKVVSKLLFGSGGSR